MTTDSRPIVGITVGDEAGIGPELVAKVLAQTDTYAWCRPLAVGSIDVMRHTIAYLGLPLSLRAVGEPTEGCFEPGTVDFLDVGGLRWCSYALGRTDAAVGRASIAYTQKAVELALAKSIDAICSAPVSKEAMHLAGYDFPGQTEFIAHLTGARKYAMMLAFSVIRVFFVTNHVALREACALITESKVREVIEVAHTALQSFGMSKPLIGVAALNPHCGEHGLMGTEERDGIIPAIERAREAGIQVEGPIPADIIFTWAKDGRYDAVIAMYHDQGNTPVKLLGFRAAVTVAVGLPVVRTSVAHGTAYDIVGKGIANSSTMSEAVKVAAELAVASGARQGVCE